MAAKRLRSFIAAIRRFDIDLWRPCEKYQALGGCRRTDPIRRPGQRLAIGAMTNAYLIGINFCLIVNLSAVTLAINFHNNLQRVLASSRRAPGARNTLPA